MSFALANATVAASQPPQGGGSAGAIETPSERNAEAAVMALKAYAQPDPSGGAETTERADAVKATPTSAPATIVDFNAQKPAGELPEYPISGPDEFARSMAVRNSEVAEEPAEPESDIESVADLAKQAEAAKSSVSGGAGDIEPVQPAWKSPVGPAKAEPAEAMADEQVRLIDLNNNAADPGASGVPEGGAEAAEARLTE